MPSTYYIRDDDVGVIKLSNPPVNSLSTGHVRSILSAFQSLQRNKTVKGIVITAEGNMFCGGADIIELEMLSLTLRKDGTGNRTSSHNPLSELGRAFNLLEDSTKTVVCAINGQALGGGLELALACHYRVASASTKIGLPEVNLGLLPGGQGTQRLTRIAGVRTALEMLLSGQPITAVVGKKYRIIDDVVDPHSNKISLLDHAAAMALSMPPRRISTVVCGSSEMVLIRAGVVEMALNQVSRLRFRQPAIDGIATCVKAAVTLNFSEGCAVEVAEFLKLLLTKESAALRSVFLASKTCGSVPRSGPLSRPQGMSTNPEMKPMLGSDIKSVGIVGGGLMGSGIAICFLNKNLKVILVDVKAEVVQKARVFVTSHFTEKVKKKKMTHMDMKNILELLETSTALQSLHDVDLVVEAVFEQIDLKAKIFKELDSICRADCILCSNTSTLNVDKIASVTSRPDRVMGMHFFSPANIMLLLEAIPGQNTTHETIVSVMNVAKFIGKTPVLVGNCDGFVGNRSVGPYLAEVLNLLEEGATIEDIEQATTSFGLRIGAVSLCDLVGLDLFWRERERRRKEGAKESECETAASLRPFEIIDWLCSQGRFGQKTAKGFFAYTGRTKSIQPDVQNAIMEISKKKGIKRREIGKDEITERCLYPLVNECFKCLEEGMAQRPTDIDVIHVFGYSFPPSLGGPLFWADNYIGLDKLLDKLILYGKHSNHLYKTTKIGFEPRYWEPSVLLRECVKEKNTLSKQWMERTKKESSKI